VLFNYGQKIYVSNPKEKGKGLLFFPKLPESLLGPKAFYSIK
jgi:hypothetical protein